MVFDFRVLFVVSLKIDTVWYLCSNLKKKSYCVVSGGVRESVVHESMLVARGDHLLLHVCFVGLSLVDGLVLKWFSFAAVIIKVHLSDAVGIIKKQHYYCSCDIEVSITQGKAERKTKEEKAEDCLESDFNLRE